MVAVVMQLKDAINSHGQMSQRWKEKIKVEKSEKKSKDDRRPKRQFKQIVSQPTQNRDLTGQFEQTI